MDPKNPEQQLSEIADDAGQVLLFDYRPIEWSELKRPDIYTMDYLYSLATQAEKQYLGDAVERYHAHREQGGSAAPVINVLAMRA